MNWFHHLFNPHCAHCREEKLENKRCASCEILTMELEKLRYDNAKLLEHILHKPEEVKLLEPEVNLRAVLPQSIPWKTRKQMLENEDREKAKLLKNQPTDAKLESLEKELGVESAS